MKSNDFLSEDIASDAHDMHLDHEVQMARKDCYAAADDAIALHKLLRNVSEQQGLEGWVAAKITLASDYLNTVREHLEYQLMSQVPAAALELPMAEGAMPPAVIKIKEKIRHMSDAEKKEYFKGKTKEQLQKMARSHGYGQDSNQYAQWATESVEEGKKADRYHIVGKDGKPASLASYADRASAVKDRDEKHPGAVVQQVGSRGKVKGVTEGVAETLSMDEAKKVLRQYGADNFKTTSNELHFYKNGKPFSVDLILNSDATRSVSLSQLNSATRRLKGQGVAEGSDISRLRDSVESAIIRRIQLQHPELLKHGPQAVMDAVTEVADSVADSGVSEIGSSDVSAWVRRVVQYLQGQKVAEDASGGASSAGAVAGVNNPGGKPKSQVGSLFGGTFQRKKKTASK